MPSYNSDVFQAPGQVTFPKDASSGYMTNKDGVVYPEEMTRVATEYAAGEGSMGFERNQAVKREGWIAPEPEYTDMGQKNLQALKSGTYGSYAIKR